MRGGRALLVGGGLGTQHGARRASRAGPEDRMIGAVQTPPPRQTASASPQAQHSGEPQTHSCSPSPALQDPSQFFVRSPSPDPRWAACWSCACWDPASVGGSPPALVSLHAHPCPARSGLPEAEVSSLIQPLLAFVHPSRAAAGFPCGFRESSGLHFLASPGPAAASTAPLPTPARAPSWPLAVFCPRERPIPRNPRRA